MQRSRLTITCGQLILVVFSGCSPSGPEIARVEGTVTLDGKPLGPKASVVFIPVSGRPAAAETDAEGKYVLEFSGGRKGAIPGMSTVQITTYVEVGYEPDGTVIPGTPERLPARYNSQTTLQFEVEPGKTNIADFDLDSKGRVAADTGGY